ncbi:ribonuclease H [Spirochaetia bacterium]|nr:ribonuclease H [Spirochaetia bacterium]
MGTGLNIYTDGGCSGNPGPGGWAYVIVLKTFQGDRILTEGQGGEKETTNNRMELMAVISALKALKTMSDVPRQATVYTDSQYVQKGITEWIFAWKRNSWRTSDKKPVKNQDLWIALDALAGELSLSWEWIKGHAGNDLNERCDRMTQAAIASIR